MKPTFHETGAPEFFHDGAWVLATKEEWDRSPEGSREILLRKEGGVAFVIRSHGRKT